MRSLRAARPRMSGVVTYYVDALPVDESGAEFAGLVRVTLEDHPLPADDQYPTPRHVYELAPGLALQDIPTPASVVIIGAPWTVDALREAYPDAALRCLDCEWAETATDPETGEQVEIVMRGREITAPQGVQLLRSGIPPHVWSEDA